MVQAANNLVRLHPTASTRSRAETPSDARKAGTQLIPQSQQARDVFVGNESARLSRFAPVPVAAEKVDPVNTQASGEELRALMIKDLEQVAEIFRQHYAPSEWKQERNGWNLQADLSTAIAAVNAMKEPNRPAYHRILKKFLMGMGDYHVGVVFHSTEKATLPFTVNTAAGRVFVMNVDRVNAPDFPLKEGDEILSFDGKPAGQAVTDLSKEVSHGAVGTDTGLASLFLTSRQGARGMTVPKGDVVVEVRSKATGKVEKHTLAWEYTENALAYPNDPPTAGKGFVRFGAQPGDWSRFGGEMSAGFFKLGHRVEEENPYGLGARKSFIPKLGKVVWEANKSSPIYGYIFKNDKGEKVGYVRIPHYMAGLPEFLAFARVLIKMRKTKALIIDQVNNPGGSVGYLYQLASTLTNKPIHPPLHRMSITLEEVGNARKILEMKDSEFQGLPEKLIDALRDNAQFIAREWDEGRTLTNAYHLGLGNYIDPAIANYNGKIMILTNHLDFSGGDFFPAIMQDAGRALIFGSRTAGAGGYVKMVNRDPNELGVKSFTFTGSMAVREDNTPLESDGVTPDVEYEMTADDLQNGYKGYTKAILSTLDELMANDATEAA